MSINIVDRADDRVTIANVLISVSDKRGLDTFIPGLKTVNPDITFFSTGGTWQRIREILGPDDPSLVQVSAYTGQPETQGGLVKTLDFKIYLGLLTETYNDAHQKDLRRTGAVAIDMAVVNLYPFKTTVATPGATVEHARGNIDIGGPCMVRASAKNFLRVASVTDPDDYPAIVSELQAEGGTIGFARRFALAQKAFAHTADYDKMIADYLNAQPVDRATACYRF